MNITASQCDRCGDAIRARAHTVEFFETTDATIGHTTARLCRQCFRRVRSIAHGLGNTTSGVSQ